MYMHGIGNMIVGLMLVAFIVGGTLFLGAGYLASDKSGLTDKQKSAITVCESNLPRNRECEIKWEASVVPLEN